MSLSFDPEKHMYLLDGCRVPSVTELIGKGLPKEGLVRWAAKSAAEYAADNLDALTGLERDRFVAEVKAAPFKKRDKAAERGTEIHALGEMLVHGAPVDVPLEHHAEVTGYARFLDEHSVEPLMTECNVASREHAYAGRFDLIAEMRGQVWIFDIKTSRGVYGSTALQLAGYANAEFYTRDEDIYTEQPLPGIERAGVLHVTANGTSLVEVQHGAEPWQDFLAVARVATARKRIDDYITTAKEAR